MERHDLEGIVRKLVTEVVSRVEQLEGAPPVVAPTRVETRPLGPPPRPASPEPAPAQPASPTPSTPPAAAHPPLSQGLSVAVGSDHGGFEMKQDLVLHLHSLGYAVVDVGTYDHEAVDYPDFAKAVAVRVARGETDRGIVIDGAGLGSCMVANKVRGVRCATCHNVKTVLNSRDHNNANVLSLGSGVVDAALAREMASTFLQTPFGGGRHSRRVAKINELDADRSP